MVKGPEHGLQGHEQHLKAIHHPVIQNLHRVLGFELDLSKEGRQCRSMNVKGEGKQVLPAVGTCAPASTRASPVPRPVAYPDPRLYPQHEGHCYFYLLPK